MDREKFAYPKEVQEHLAYVQEVKDKKERKQMYLYELKEKELAKIKPPLRKQLLHKI